VEQHVNYVCNSATRCFTYQLAAMGAPNGPPTRPVKRIGIGDLMRIMPLAGLVPPPSPISEPLSAYRSLLGLTAMPDEKPKTSIFSAGLGLPPEK